MRRREIGRTLCLVLVLAAVTICIASRDLNVPFHEQITNTSCGAACLQSTMEYWGVTMTQDQMLNSAPPDSRHGYSIGELKAISIGKGLQAFGVAVKMDFLEGQTDKGRPVIVPIMIHYDEYRMNFAARVPVIGELFDLFRDGVVPNFSHFVIVCGIVGDTVSVMDPMYGHVSIPRDRFEEMWSETGNAALLVAS